MDELVIGDLRYVSSKKAAKLTGYAKDYVGQLCREGKVEARLVGRNWYVLESSILGHRFGDQDLGEVAETSPTREPEVKWEAPKYTSEEISELPQISPVTERYTEVRNSEIPPKISTNPVPDMQSAWKEWFQAKEELEQLPELESGDDMLLRDADELETPNLLTQEVPMGTYATPQEPEDEPHVVEIHKKDPEIKEFYSISPTRYEETPREVREEVGIQKRQSGMPTSNMPKKVRAESKPRDKKRKRGGIAQILLFALLFLIISVTYLAITSIHDSEQGGGNGFVNFLNGVSSVE